MDFKPLFSIPLSTMIILMSAITFLLSFIMTKLIYSIAIRKKILAIPNERSSHHVPTPVGGGIAIVASFSLMLFCLAWNEMVEMRLVWTLGVGGLIIAVVGYCDDVFTVPIGIRIVFHFLVAFWAIYWAQGYATINFGLGQFTLSGSGSVLAAIGIVWCINLYNFMDGIDGIASSEGIFACLAAALVLFLANEINLALLLILFAASIAGFMTWNWPPAKIFMGDVGSGFLGYTFAVLILFTGNKEILPTAFWMIVLGVFLWDATFTLLLRAAQGKKWYSGHREHAYQTLTNVGLTHKQITLLISLFNLCLLLPLACASYQWPEYTFWFLMTSIFTLGMVWQSIKMIKFSRETGI